MQNLNNFKRSLEFTLKWEGVYVNDPKDPGGETKWGISKRAHPSEDIRNLTPERAAQIYADDYWDKCGLDERDFPLCAVVFDTAVNQGVGRAQGFLKQTTDPMQYCNLRIDYYLGLVKKTPHYRSICGAG
jgi:lysozyme family protein